MERYRDSVETLLGVVVGAPSIIGLTTCEAHADRRELIAESDRIRAMTPVPLSDSTELLRQDRNRR